MNRKIITLLSFGTLLIFGVQTQAQTLRVLTVEYSPYEYSVSNGADDDVAADGVAVRVVRAAFAKMNQDISVEFFPWKRALQMVRIGEADAIFTIFKTSDREEFLYYPEEPLLYQTMSIWKNHRADLDFSGKLESVKGASVGLVDGFSYGDFVDEALRSNVLDNIDYVSDSLLNVKKLVAGRVDFIITDDYNAVAQLAMLNASDKAVKLTPSISSPASYIAFSKANDLEDISIKINQVLLDMKSSGEHQKIIDGYLMKTAY